MRPVVLTEVKRMENFDAEAVTAQLKAQTKARRKPRTYAQRRSVLDTYLYELLKLDAAGCNGSELQRWLVNKDVQVERSTINRWLHRNRPDG